MRIALVIPVVYCFLNQYFTIALILFTVAGVSDALDGYLAKKYDWSSQLGSFLDPLADKLLLVSCFLVGVIIEVIPAWLFAMILARDLIVAFGALVYHFMIEKFYGEPPFSSKLNTALQIVYLVLIMATQELLSFPETWMTFLLYSVAATTVLSGCEYVWIWSLKAWKKRIGKHHE